MKENPGSGALDQTEARAAHGAEGNRISLAEVRDYVDHFWWVNGLEAIPERGSLMASAPLACLTLCLMVLKNGYVVVGKSMPIDPNNFDPEKGRAFSYDDAIRQVWPLMAFRSLEARRKQE